MRYQAALGYSGSTPSPPNPMPGWLLSARILHGRILVLSRDCTGAIWTIKSIVSPFIYFDDQDAHRDDESEKQNCLNNHPIDPRTTNSMEP